MKRKFTLLILLNFLLTCGITAQDFDFSQWYNNPTYYNPAYVGLTSGLKARFTYRRQMVKVPASFRTYSFSADIAEPPRSRRPRDHCCEPQCLPGTGKPYNCRYYALCKGPDRRLYDHANGYTSNFCAKKDKLGQPHLS